MCLTDRCKRRKMDYAIVEKKTMKEKRANQLE